MYENTNTINNITNKTIICVLVWLAEQSQVSVDQVRLTGVLVLAAVSRDMVISLR